MHGIALPVATERLYLRGFDPDDLDALTIFYLMPEAQRYLDLKARDRGEVQAALDVMCGQTGLTRPGDTLSIAVERKSDGALVGMVTLTWTDAAASQAELRFVFNPAVSRGGYRAEALQKALDLGFGELGFHRIYVRCGGSSQGSARLLRRLGLRLEAHYREHALFQGEWDEELLFAVLNREWARGVEVTEMHHQAIH